MLFPFFSFLLFFLIFAPVASAHGFGQQYTLPLPVWMYVFGGGVTVFLSFLIISFFITPKPPSQKKKKLSFSLPKKPTSFLILFFQLFSVFFFFLSLISGFIGLDISSLNINMTYFWVIIFIGGVYLSSIIGNLWEKFSPVGNLISFIEWATNEKITGIIEYPQKLGSLPSFLAMFVLLLCEFIFPTSPFTLSILLLFYLSYLTTGCVLFGKDQWTTHADPLYTYFSLIGELSLLKKEKQHVVLSFPGKYALISSFSFLSLCFILLLLSSTAVDGFVETSLWFQWYYDYFSFLSFVGYQGIQILFLLGVFLFFLLCYTFTSYLVGKITKTSLTTSLLGFVGTLLPIVLAYHIAHYLSLFLNQGQAFFALLSDPFGYGWNLFGTASFSPNISLTDAGLFWHIQLGAIIVGHIWAVVLSHLKAIELFGKKYSILSQIPFLILMIFYTIGGLWLLSQPVGS